MRSKINQILGTVLIMAILFVMGSVTYTHASDSTKISDPSTSDQNKPGDHHMAPAQKPAFKPSIKPFGMFAMYWDSYLNDPTSSNGVKANDWKGKTGTNIYLRRARMGAKGDVTERFSVNMTLDVAPTGSVGWGRIVNAWAKYKIMPGMLDLRFGYMETIFLREALSSGRFLFNDVAAASSNMNYKSSDPLGTATSSSISPHYILGFELNAMFLKKQLNIWLWFGNADGTYTGANNNNLKMYNHFRVGGRVQYDFFKPWREGAEWLHPGDAMNATIGIGASYTAQESTTANNTFTGVTSVESASAIDVLRVSADAGFRMKGLYVFGSFYVLKSNKPYAPSTVGYETYKGWHADIAYSFMIFAPAIRLEGYNTPATETTNWGNYKYMTLRFVFNIFPTGLSHRWKIQPEVAMDLSAKRFSSFTTNSAGSLGKGDTSKRILLRIGNTITF